MKAKRYTQPRGKKTPYQNKIINYKCINKSQKKANASSSLSKVQKEKRKKYYNIINKQIYTENHNQNYTFNRNNLHTHAYVYNLKRKIKKKLNKQLHSYTHLISPSSV